MAKNQSRDPLLLTSHWHIDCRLPAELPDDRVVSSRFLANLPFGLMTLGLFVFFCWQLSSDLSLRANVADLNRRLAESRVTVATIKQQQRDYTTLAFKIETAHTLMKNRLFISHFMTQLSRARPGTMVIESVEGLEVAIVVRGSMSGAAEKAGAEIGNYVETLRKDSEIGPSFETILVSNFERPPGGDRQNFELTFKFRTEPPSA
ncbi:MAG: hypothetical protein JWM88_3451 [Verrucomicrobia bacterium]|nr:hypothetical protein [Verrucomicrobiota bacterium]